jgi:gluconokinase
MLLAEVRRSDCNGRAGPDLATRRGMRDGYALGVDLGTGSARAFVFERSGARRGGVRLPYTWRIDTDGGVEADADELVRLVCTAIDGALQHMPHDGEIVAVGFSMLWHTILGVDASGDAVTPALAWNDTRATSAAQRLRERIDERSYHARTGAMLHPSYPPARIAWLREQCSTPVHRWLSLPEYVWLRLAGSCDVDVSMAAGSGLLDRHSLTWDEEIAQAVGISTSQLGDVAIGTNAARSGHDVALCTRWPQLRNALWRMPIGDGACANIGSGCTDAASMGLSIGTSAALRIVVPRGEDLPHGLFSYAVDGERALLGGAISNGGIVGQWLRETLRLPDDDAALDTLLLARPAAAHGLRFLPFLAGERSPDWPLHAVGTLHGLRAATSPLDILQAGLEAVAYRLVGIHRLIRQAAPGATRVVAGGGALQRSTYWPQLLADVLGERVEVCVEAETSSRGAALLALLAAGHFETLESLPAAPTAATDPGLSAHLRHTQALADYLRLARDVLEW